MNIAAKKKIVLLGIMSKFPVAGASWGMIQYLVGFQRLGYDVYYVEAHAGTPSMLMERKDDDSSAKAVAYISGIMNRFDMAGRWAFHALHDDGRCYGMSENQLKQLYSSADLLINYHGGTFPLPEHIATGRLVYLETDPVKLELELYNNDPAAIGVLEPHIAFFTWGLNYGNLDCQVPLPEGFHFYPMPPAVVLDLWQPFGYHNCPRLHFTTVGNWRQPGQACYRGEIYYWSKDREYLKFIDLPMHTTQRFELGLSLASCDQNDLRLLETNGWKVRDGFGLSRDLDTYRSYITSSRGEFTVAKDQNVRLRSGWFSERSAQYLAAGRPVITQETGFSNVLPTGRGLFAFSTMEEIIAAVEKINSDYETHCRAALEIAREYFSYDVVLKRFLADSGS